MVMRKALRRQAEQQAGWMADRLLILFQQAGKGCAVFWAEAVKPFLRPKATEAFLRFQALQELVGPKATEAFLRPKATEAFLRLQALQQLVGPEATETFLRWE